MANKQLINKLNKSVANLQVLYVKLHNYHWNVKGPQFFSIHQVTESYYDYIAQQYDVIAERILQLEAKPLTTLTEYLENATIKEETGKDFNPPYILEKLIADFCQLKNDFKEISNLANKNDDVTTAAIADENIAWLEKAIWMLKASK